MGEDWFRQEVMCEFIDSGGAVFRRDLIDAASSSDVLSWRSWQFVRASA